LKTKSGGGGRGGPPPPPPAYFGFLGEKKSQKEEKPAGKAKQNRAPLLSQGLDPPPKAT